MAGQVAVRNALTAIALVACRGESTPAPHEATGTAPSPEHAVAALRSLLDAQRDGDDPTLARLFAKDALLLPGDSKRDTLDIGAVELRKRAQPSPTGKTTCTLEVTIASGTEAVGLALCEKRIVAKKPPLQRTARFHAAYDLHFDDSGAIDRVTHWFDILRMFRQLGVATDADPTPETARSTTAAIAAGPSNPDNARVAREIIDALERRDAAALGTRFADNYVQHAVDRTEPRTYATGASYADAAAAQLKRCSASTYQLHSLLSAGDWVAVRFGESCRLAADEPDAPDTAGRNAYLGHLWLLRFEHGRVAETWDFASRYTEWLVLGRLKNHALPEKIAAAGL